MYFGSIRSLELEQVIDEVCVVYYKAPSSYTGDDVVEIQGHSNPFILKQIIELCVKEGARLAVAGEFTKMAYINGKISLEKAEAVIDFIHASSEKAHAVSLSHFKGSLLTKLSDVHTYLSSILEQIEGSIDFPDEVFCFIVSS